MDGFVDRQALQDIADAIREKNGSSDTYTPSEMAEAIKNIESTGGAGFDFSSIYGKNEAEDFNSFYLDRYNQKIAYAEEIKSYIESNNLTNWASLCVNKFPNPEIFPVPNIKPTNLNRAWANCSNIIKFPYIDVSTASDFSYAWQKVSCKTFPRLDFSNGSTFSFAWSECRNLEELPFESLPNAKSCGYMFQDCDNLVAEYFNMKPTSMEGTFVRCSKLPNIYVDCSNNTKFGTTFYGCTKVSKLHIKSVKKSNGFSNTFYNLTSLTELLAEEWMKYNISVAQSPNLLPSSIHYIIQNAIDVADGATARTLTLHATAKANWEASEYYEQDLAVLTDKGITIA